MTETQKNPLAEEFNAISLIRFAFPSMVMMLFMDLCLQKIAEKERKYKSD